jgi:hypothetical protein
MSTMFLFSVAKALKETKASKSTLKNVAETEFAWNTFGKKDSHLLRAKLFNIFNKNKVEIEARFMVYFFFAMIKNRSRILNSFDELPENFKNMTSVQSAKTFITDHMVQYTSQESSKKFAAVHLPTTMPGLDIMATALTCEDNFEDLENIIYTKQTFAQIHIDEKLQGINRAAQKMFWDSMVKTSHNQARNTKQVTEEFKFHENYYNTSAADKYFLIDVNNEEVPPKDTNTGYTDDEVKKWFKNIQSEKKKWKENKSESTKAESK